MMSNTKIFCKIDNLLSFEKKGLLPGGDRSLNKISDIDRLTIIGWMYSVYKNFKFKKETLLHAIVLLNKCMELLPNFEKRTKLIAICCLQISSKKYEIYSPEVGDYVFICNNEYSNSSIRKTEIEIFRTIGYNAEYPNIMEYVRCISTLTLTDYHTYYLTYVLCLCYMVGDIINLPSIVVTAARNLAFYITSGLMLSLTKENNPFNVTDDALKNLCITIYERTCIMTGDKVLSTALFADLKKNVSDIDNWDIVINKLSGIPLINNMDIIYSRFMIADKPNLLEENTTKYYLPNRKTVKLINEDEVKSFHKLGEGSFGKVKKVTIHGKEYANKVMRYDSDEGFTGDFIKEVSILQTLSHKNIIAMHYIVSGKLNQSIILDFMDSDLRRYIQDYSHITELSKFQEFCTEELLCGMVYMHDHGVINRDIKPQNILIKGVWPDVSIKYCDFGGSTGSYITMAEAPYTSEVVTLWYRPPEILLGCKVYGAPIDVWSLMCTLSEICTGKVLFPGDCGIDQMHKIFQVMGTPTEDDWKGVSSLSDYRTNFPMWKKRALYTPSTQSTKVSNIINTGLVMDPSQRPTARELYTLFNS